jgi:hypothetical protein
VQDEDYGVWREKGRQVGRKLLETLDVLALEDAIRRPGGSGLDPELRRHPKRSNAYRIGLRDVLREHQAMPKSED